ncbi:MAG: prepilin peptidase [Chloroflexi bacterium]|nr:prepilin peptidase [Chloroflexota bacterium]
MVRIVEDAVLVAFVLTVITTDWRWQRIPNAVTYPTMIVGLALGLLEALTGEAAGIGAPFDGGFLDHLAGLVVAFLVSYPFYAARGLKAGDAKMLMAMGAVRGGIFLLRAALYGALAGGVLALVLIGARRLAPPETEVADPFWRLMKSRIPYGVALGVGALLALAGSP